MADDTPIMIDNGSGFMKAGQSGEEVPSNVFPSVVGRAKYGQIVGQSDKDMFIGKDAIQKRGVLSLSYPVAAGVVNNWDDMTAVWEYTYNNELRIASEERPVHLSEAPMNPTKNREQMLGIFFENFCVPAFYVSIQAVLALYATGRTMGCVLDSGDGVTHTVPVYDGYSMKHAIQRMNIAGRILTQNMSDILMEANITLTATNEMDIVSDIKTKCCRVALDFEEEKAKFVSDKSLETSFELPDGQVVTFGDQQIRVPEVLFNPSIIGKDQSGIHKVVYETVQKCDIDVRRTLYENVVLSGGNTMFPGMPERITKEVKGLVNASVQVKVCAPADRQYSVWMGGSTLSGLATFSTMWVTKGEFEEIGTNIVHRKCFM